jgi:hypothetical protein
MVARLKSWLKELVEFYEQEPLTVLLAVMLIAFLLITPVILSALTYQEYQRFLEFQRMINSSWDCNDSFNITVMLKNNYSVKMWYERTGFIELVD